MSIKNESTRPPVSCSIVYAIAITGLLAGSLDIMFALIQYYLKSDKNPIVVLKFIASAVFGKEALTGGYFMAWVGLLFHFLIAFGWTIFFFLIYPRIPLLSKNKFVTGLFYGIFIWLVMNLLLLPLTKVPPSSLIAANAITGMLLLVVAVGLPISILANRYYLKRWERRCYQNIHSVI